MKNNQHFSSILGFLIVTIGFAVGVGTLWRFPYMVGANGGAIFLFVFFVLILLIGIPLLAAEISIGFKTQKTTLQAYEELSSNRLWKIIGFIHILAAIFILSYTIPVYAWILDYIYKTGIGFFIDKNSQEISEYFSILLSSKWNVFCFALLNWFFLSIVLKGGLQGGVERASKFLLPLLGLIVLIIIVIGLRLPNSFEGVVFLFKPDMSKFSFNSLIDALGQVFFAIGIGMLASMVFGSYLKNNKEKIFKHSSTICSTILFSGIAAGLMIFPIVFAFGLSPSGGPGLTFVTLPNAFNQMPFGVLFGTLFYVGFYIAAFTSALGVFEALIGVCMSELKVSRNKALAMTMGVVMILGTLTIFYAPLFDILDMITTNYLIVLGVLGMSVFVGWIWGVDNFIKAANVNNAFIKLWLKVSVKYISPILIIIVFVTQFVK